MEPFSYFWKYENASADMNKKQRKNRVDFNMLEVRDKIRDKKQLIIFERLNKR